MALDWYLKKFKQIYSSGPNLGEVFPLYQRALAGIPEFLVDVACEEVLKQCKFFPTAAEILSFVPEQDRFQGTAPFDLLADFIPIKSWFEKHTKTHNLQISRDKHGRKKVRQVLARPEHELVSWTEHWPTKDCQPMSWIQAREKLKIVAKAKTL